MHEPSYCRAGDGKLHMTYDRGTMPGYRTFCGKQVTGIMLQGNPLDPDAKHDEPDCTVCRNRWYVMDGGRPETLCRGVYNPVPVEQSRGYTPPRGKRRR